MSSELRARLLGVVVALAALAGAGCVTMDVPERFLVIDRGPGLLKALTPEESKLQVRDFDDPTKATLAFWRDALKADLVKNRGYTLLDEGTAKDGAGHDGLTMTFEVSLGGRPYRELLAVFVLPGWCSHTVRTVEYVAEKEPFDAEVAGVRAALASLR